MKKHLSKLLLLPLVGISATFAQTNTTEIDWQNVREGETVEYCKEHKLTNEMLQDASFAKQWNKDREALAQHLAEMKAKEDHIPGKATVYRIPVVFHILHDGGVENVSREQVEDAIRVMNRDYRRLNADADNVQPEFQSMPTDVEIEFVLARKAPDGTCFSGITRTQSALTFDGSNGTAQANAVRNGNDVYRGEWPGNRYLNVFVADDIGGAAGYTRRPFSSQWGGASMNNGIWCLHTYLGSIGTADEYRSRTMTHEVGHWLDLPHCWGNTNNPGLQSNCSTDDNITDTPNTTGVTSCNLNEQGCGPKANVENYMDYSYCSKMFTPGQVDRMRAAITSNVGGRSNVISAGNLAFTGADSNFVLCEAEFRNGSNTTICAGSTVDFIDETYNTVNGWSWSFPGGSPATSTMQNPTVTYSTPGTYAVTLTATDGQTTKTTTKTDYLTVLPAGTALPYLETFENYGSLSDANSFWRVDNGGGTAGFEVTNQAGKSGTKSVKLANFGQSANGIDAFTSDNFDLSALTSSDNVTLSFVYAYRKRNASNYESLKVLVSKDCGENFVARKTLNGPSLGNEVSTSNWTPSSDEDWTQVHVVNIVSSYFVTNLQVQFEFTSDQGNNLYIDDINFYEGDPSSLSLIERAGLSGITLYPNPANELVNLKFEATNNGAVEVELVDLTGKTVQATTVQATTGKNLVMMGTSDLAPGMYMMNINSNGIQKALPFVIK